MVVPSSLRWWRVDGRAVACSRGYRVEGSRNTALSLAFNQRCDMVAATALVGPGAPASLEPAVLAFLNSERMLKWAEVALGL